MAVHSSMSVAVSCAPGNLGQQGTQPANASPSSEYNRSCSRGQADDMPSLPALLLLTDQGDGAGRGRKCPDARPRSLHLGPAATPNRDEIAPDGLPLSRGLGPAICQEIAALSARCERETSHMQPREAFPMAVKPCRPSLRRDHGCSVGWDDHRQG